MRAAIGKSKTRSSETERVLRSPRSPRTAEALQRPRKRSTADGQSDVTNLSSGREELRSRRSFLHVQAQRRRMLVSIALLFVIGAIALRAVHVAGVERQDIAERAARRITAAVKSSKIGSNHADTARGAAGAARAPSSQDEEVAELTATDEILDRAWVPLKSERNDLNDENVPFFTPIKRSERRYERLRRWKGRSGHVEGMWLVRDACFEPATSSFPVRRASLRDLLEEHTKEDNWLKIVDASTQISRSQVKYRVPGVTVMSRNFAADNTGAHFTFYTIPLMGVMRFATEVLHGDVSLVLPKARIPPLPHRRRLERRQFDHMFLQAQRVLSLDAPVVANMSQGNYVCFDELLSIGRNYYNIISGPEDASYARANVMATTDLHLENECYGPDHDPQDTIYILNRRVYARRILNVDEIVEAVRDVAGPGIKIKVFDSPNAACQNSRGCYGFANCEELWSRNDSTWFNPPCKTIATIDDDIELFNKITFMISVHGAGNANMFWMPRGSVLLEMFPYGVMDRSYITLANYTQTNYFQYRERNSEIADSHFGQHHAEDKIWADNSMRTDIKHLPVKINVQNFRPTLERAFAAWTKGCKTIAS